MNGFIFFRRSANLFLLSRLVGGSHYRDLAHRRHLAKRWRCAWLSIQTVVLAIVYLGSLSSLGDLEVRWHLGYPTIHLECVVWWVNACIDRSRALTFTRNTGTAYDKIEPLKWTQHWQTTIYLSFRVSLDIHRDHCHHLFIRVTVVESMQINKESTYVHQVCLDCLEDHSGLGDPISRENNRGNRRFFSSYRHTKSPGAPRKPGDPCVPGAPALPGAKFNSV